MLRLNSRISKFFKLSIEQINEQILNHPPNSKETPKSKSQFSSGFKQEHESENPLEIIISRKLKDLHKASIETASEDNTWTKHCIFDFKFQNKIKKNEDISTFKVTKKDKKWKGILTVLPKNSLIRERHSVKRPPGSLEQKTLQLRALDPQIQMSFQDKYNLYYIQRGVYYGTLADLMTRNKTFSEEEIKFVAICCFFGNLALDQ